MAAPPPASALSWAMHCVRCESQLVDHGHLEFLQENERSVHLGLRRHHFEEIQESDAAVERTLRSKTHPQAVSFTKIPQSNAGKLAHAPFTLSCPTCQIKIGSELVMTGWARPEHLFDSKACVCLVSIQSADGTTTVPERVVFKKYARLLDLLREKNVDLCVRNPTSSGETTDESETEDNWREAKRTPKRTKTRGAPAAPMVWPTADSIREQFSQFTQQSKLSTLRDYQLELVLDALQENSIIYLPTGCGKTLVAVRVISAFKMLNPNRKAAFLVPTGPLVSQQASYLRRESDLNVIELSGQHADANDRRKRRQKVAQADALVATPQFFENMLSNSEVALDHFCVLVFDEAHHATGDDPNCDVLKRVAAMEMERRPRIVALTASPFGQQVKPSSMATNSVVNGLCRAYNAKLDTPTIVDSLRQLGSAFKQVDFTTVDQELPARQLQLAIYQHIRAVSNVLCSLSENGAMLRLDGLSFRVDGDDSDCSEDIFVLCGKLRKLEPRLCGASPTHEDYRADIASVLVHMRRILMVLPQMSIHSPTNLANLLREYFIRIQETEPQLFVLIKPHYEQQFGTVLDSLLAYPATGTWRDDVSSKVQAVAAIVEESNFDRNSRAIVFVRRRKTAVWLAEVMGKVPILAQLNPTRFIGHNSYEGMTWEEEQRPTLERFRQGRIRMLVATSVLEEGLDVPECSLVIRFDGVVGMTSLVQSRGRARQSKGRFVIMCSDTKRNKLEAMIQNEVEMLEMARIEANTMESKSVTRLLMDELAMCESYERCEEPRSMPSHPPDQPEIDWSEMDTKLCVMFGILASDPRTQQQTDLMAVIRAIDDCGCVDVSQADTSLGLVAVEASELNGSTSDFNALYHELCQRLTFRISGRDSDESPASACSFWIQMVAAPSVVSRGVDPAQVINGVLVEEPSDTSVWCESVRRGRFVRQNAFVNLEEFRFSAAKLTKWASSLVLEDGDYQRYEFDLLSVHDRTVWIETKSATEWVLYLTFRNPPKIWWVRNSSRDCRSFHLVPLTFAMDVISTSHVGISSLRQQLIDQGLEVRDTKMDAADLTEEEWSLSSMVASTRETISEPTMISYAKLSLMSTWCFAFGGYVPTRIVEMVRRIDNDALRVQVMIRFEPNATTEEELVREFRSYIETQYPALTGLAKLQQRLILKAIVTPTRILFERPEIAPPNRVFRQFDSENFLYVYFRDENRERLDFSDEALAGRVRDVMLNGIHVGDFHFQFLGCSLSQLRNANCVFTVLDPDEVRLWMGDLHEILSPAKYLKRLGQAFSSTQESISVHPEVLLTPKKDIKDVSGKYTFTDGCGEITTSAAHNVARALRISPVPAAFQIRLAGAKGVLVVSDFMPKAPDFGVEDEPEDGDRGIRLRKSQVKFKSPHNKLEIVAVASAHSVAYLSRQSILILSDLGIDDAVFLNLQDEFMLSLSTMVVSEQLGLQEVRGAVPPDQNWWMDVLYNILPSDPLKIDPYHRRIVHAIYQYKLTNTVLRARIPITKGRALMGVADFTGILNYGEVFVQYTERDPSGDTDLERVIVLADVDVLVHRSPCHHPGDLRVLRCVGSQDVPAALSQLRDCIVFPTRGPRPHPDECTGGDLDGDVYTVIWDERLIPPRENIVEAMTLVEVDDTPKEDQLVDVPRLVDFYLFALEHDILGMASNAHMAVSDISPEGCLARDAQVLADICSREVDCCKNPAFLKIVQKLMPHKYPDFLQNKEKGSYKSQKALGKMYRRALALLMHTAPNFGGACANDVDESYLTDGYLKHLRVARVIYNQYKLAVRMVLQSCGALSEAELATGMIIEMASEYRADYFRFGERSRDVFYSIQRTFRDHFDRAYNGRSEHVRRRVAAAWYAVAYRDPSDDRLLSFPWILANLLITNKSTRSNSDSAREVPQAPTGDLAISAALALVTSQLQLSILSEMEERFSALLTAYHERLQAVAALRLALNPHFDDQDVGCVLFGSSALLTFEAQSDLDIVLPSISTTAQLRELAQFATSAGNGLASVQLRERTHVPVLSLSLDEVWTVEISSARNGPIKTAWFRAYMVEYTFFWPAAYFLIKWGKAASLIRRRCLDGSGNGRSMVLPVGFLWLFLDFCIKHEFVEPLECPDWRDLALTDTEIENSFWSNLLQRSIRSSHEPTAARVMLAFFRYFGDLATPPSAFGFVDPLDPQNNTTLTAEHVEIFREQCYVAHHQLIVSNGDLASLLKHQPDHRRRITLSRALSKHVHRSPEFFAAKILSESGVNHAHATLAFAHHPNALRADLYVADVMGDGESVQRIEQKIERIEEQLGAPQMHRPTENIHRSGCTLLLLEGAVQQTEKLGFQRYFAARHAQHETLELHQAHLVSFSNGKQWLEHAIGSFAIKFMRQMVKLTHFEKLNPGVARSKAIVRFGHHYLINLPWSFHEESISLATIEMLEREFERGREARELYESVLMARKRDRDEKKHDAAEDADEEVVWQSNKKTSGEDDSDDWGRGGGGAGGGAGGGGGGRDGDGGGEVGDGRNNEGDKDEIHTYDTRLPLSLDKATAMTSRDRGVAHSFYPMIAPHAAHHLHDFAAKRKHMRVVAKNESFQVSIVRDGFEFNVRLTPQLQLVKVKTRASRWLSATIKMRQELVSDRSGMDATPDVRLYVSGSEDVPSSDPLPQTLERACAKAPNGHGVLTFLAPRSGDHVPRVRVSSELLDEGIELCEIVNVRHMRCTKYQSPHDGVELRVLQVVEFAVPKPDARDGFVSETRKTECEIVMPPLTADVRVDAAFARRFLLAGVDLVEFLREQMRHGLDEASE